MKKMSKYKVYHPQFGFVGVLMLPSGLSEHVSKVLAMKELSDEWDRYDEDCDFEEAKK